MNTAITEIEVSHRKTKTDYNEWSFGADLVSEANIYLESRNFEIKKAGAERFAGNTRKRSDVIFFKDKSCRNSVISGELKFPDTKIDDEEFISDAIFKAKTRGHNCFFLCNVTEAVVYIKNEDGVFLPTGQKWQTSIKSRGDVNSNQEEWAEMLHNIIDYLNEFLRSGKIKNPDSSKIISPEEIGNTILDSLTNTILFLEEQLKYSLQKAKIDRWWEEVANNYGHQIKDNKQKFETLAKHILFRWFHKLLVANIIGKKDNDVRTLMSGISTGTTISEAIDIIKCINNIQKLSAFDEHILQEALPIEVWERLIELNLILWENAFTKMSHQSIKNLYVVLNDLGKRRTDGQYDTGKNFTELLVRLTMDDINKTVYDPFCGIGTTGEEVLLIKEESRIGRDEALKSTFLSDKNTTAIELAKIKMTNIDCQVNPNIFVYDLFKSDDLSGDLFKSVGVNGFDNIISAVPFIRHEDSKNYVPYLVKINEWIKNMLPDSEPINNQSDMFVYAPFYLYQILNNNGKIGLVLSNAWLGTNYGKDFIKLFRRFYDIEYIIISGNVKFCEDSGGMTSLLIAKKIDNLMLPTDQKDKENKILFCTIKQKIENINIKSLARDILLYKENSKDISCPNDVDITTLTYDEIKKLESQGRTWSSFFVAQDFIKNAHNLNKVIKAKKIFAIQRGIKTECNDFFIRKNKTEINEIEKECFQPILKNLRSTKGLIAFPNALLFCCTDLESELSNKMNSVAWGHIEKFKRKISQEKIDSRYKLNTNIKADFVTNLNPHKSLFFAKLYGSGLIDQRSIGLLIQDNYKKDTELLFALLNSTFSMYCIESIGFSRAQKALDLNGKKFEECFDILNPNFLSDDKKYEIIKSFEPLTTRDRLPLEEELLDKDRIFFESTVCNAYNLDEQEIKDALMKLYKIRFQIYEHN